MSRILFFLVAIIAVVIAILVFAPGVVPVAAYKERVETAASDAVGRQVTIGDDLSFRIFPTTAFHVTDLAIANGEGFEGDHFIRVAQADIGVKLGKLLSGSVEVDKFILNEPEINLVRAANGAVNWNFAEGGTPEGEEAAGSNRSFRDVKLGDVRIINGKARYRDLGANRNYAAENMNLRVLLKSLREPLEVDGDMVFQGEASTVDIVLTSLADMLENKPSNLKLDMKVGKTEAGADVTIENEDGFRYSGPIKLNAPDLPAFAALAGTKLADGPGFDRLSLAGNVDGGAKSLRLSNAVIGFDEIDGQGVLNLDWSGARPKAGGILSTSKLDLRPYMPPPTKSAGGFPEWSTAKMDFTSLRNIDADFDISTDAIFLNDLEIGESRLKLRIDNGRMTTDIPELAMYGGQGSGRLVVNARGATPSFAGNLDMNSVNAQPFSLDLLKHDNLLGLGSLEFDFTASGASQAAIMNSLDGEGGFDLANGALKGVNIAKIARAVAQFQDGFNPAALASAVTAARGPDETTDFSEFLSDFRIDNGLVNAPSIKLNGPYLTMTGGGSINLPRQAIDLRLSPRATTTIDGVDGRTITIPLRVGGSFSQPTIGIDAEAFFRSGAQEQLRGLFEGLGGKNNNNTSGGAANDNTAPAEEAAPAEETPEEAAIRAIEGLFGLPADDDETTDDQSGGQGGGSASLEEAVATQAINALFGLPAASEDEAETEN